MQHTVSIIFSNCFFTFIKERKTVVTSSGVVDVKKKGIFNCYLSAISQVFGYQRNKFRQFFSYVSIKLVNLLQIAS